MQKLCGLVGMPLVGEVFLFTGQPWRILGFFCLLYHQLPPCFTTLVYWAFNTSRIFCWCFVISLLSINNYFLCLWYYTKLLTAGHDNDNGTCEVSFWEELPCGIYSISFDARSTDGCLVGEVKRHEWTNESLKELVEWKRTCIVPKPGDISSSYHEDLLSQHESNSACLHNLQSVSGIYYSSSLWCQNLDTKVPILW